MYTVPMDMPTHCNKCPFGYCIYSLPFGSSCLSNIDGKENKTDTYGYVCNLDFHENRKYTKILRAEIGEPIKAPEWCGLQEVKSE